MYQFLSLFWQHLYNAYFVWRHYFSQYKRAVLPLGFVLIIYRGYLAGFRAVALIKIWRRQHQ